MKIQQDRGARTYLIDKIIKGGSGYGVKRHGCTSQFVDFRRGQIVRWILSFGNKGAIQNPYHFGMVASTLDKTGKDNGVLSISASYTDAGGGDQTSLEGVR
ncbi:MAG: hypothetical protein IPO25_22725 [Saprospiraceae bacterium]|nr:hypothetical protein [Saprospiraceae bacterium]